ncbi:unnamed protein product, partial [Meganyctiphanes norvegica]
RSKTCPQCRQNSREKNVVRLYFDTSQADASQADPDTLQNMNESLKFQVRLKEQESINIKEANIDLTRKNKGIKAECKDLEGQVRAKDTTITALKTQLKMLTVISNEAKKAKEDLKAAKLQLTTMHNAESVINGTSEDVEIMLRNYEQNPQSTRSLATFCSILKKELAKCDGDKRRYRDEASSLKNRIKEVRTALQGSDMERSTLQVVNKQLTEDRESLEKEVSSMKRKIEALQSAIISPSGDIKNSAIHRLIAESPAPMELKYLKRAKPASSDEDPMFATPDVVRKMAKLQDVSPDDANGDIIFDLDDDSPVSSGQSNALQPSLQSNKIARSQSESASPYLPVKFSASLQGHQSSRVLASLSSNPGVNIFKKDKPSLQTSLSQMSRSQEKFGFDGMGGHSKVDEFPKPKPVFLKKKTGIRVVTKGGNGARVQTNTLKNFFGNTFDD